MLTLDDMTYSADTKRTNPETGGCNEYYRGNLDNGDVVQLSHHGYYANRYWWEWAVFVPDNFPFSAYQKSIRTHLPETAEDCLTDFHDCYKGRNWLTRAETAALYGPEYARCIECGWEGLADDLIPVTVYEDYGDVSSSKCPSCGRVERDGEMLFEMFREEN